MTGVRQALDHLDDDEKRVCSVSTPEGKQDQLVISESGFYSLALISDVPEAKVFKRWVTHEVLPEIRRTGRYEIGPERHGVFDAIKRMIDTWHAQESKMHARED